MTDARAPVEFSADLVTSLLAKLDDRLRRRGARASVFVVGGAAIAAKGIRAGRLTTDVDGLHEDPAVAEEAEALAAELGLPAHWLNTSAGM